MTRCFFSVKILLLNKISVLVTCLVMVDLSVTGQGAEKMFEEIKGVNLTYDVNYKFLPITICPVTEEGAKRFNKILATVRALGFEKIIRTPSGSISKNAVNFCPPMYDVRALNSCVELTVIDYKCFRVQFRNDAEVAKGAGVSGKQAYNAFCNVCKKFNINLSALAIPNGEEIKKSIPAPLIWLDPQFEDFTFKRAYHIDIHSAYMASIAEAYPVLRPAIEEIYNNRKDEKHNKLYKAILTHSFGFFQSKMVDYKFSHLSKAAITGTIKKLADLSQRILKSGGYIIAYNTDGIWYIGDEYHGEGEGKGLGEWENDHKVDKLIFKGGIGTYGFVENGVFTPKVRGLRALDKVKARSAWTEKDLDNLGAPLKYGWNGEEIVKMESERWEKI